MLHPSFEDGVIFALQQDGTERFVFMVEENQSNFFHPKSLKELTAYFENKERSNIEKKATRKKNLVETTRNQTKRNKRISDRTEKTEKRVKSSLCLD